MTNNHRRNCTNKRSSYQNKTVKYQQRQKRKHRQMSDYRNQQQHDVDELDHYQVSPRRSIRLQSNNNNNSRQQIDRSSSLAHNTDSRYGNTEAASKQSSADLAQADDSSVSSSNYIADVVQGYTEAQMAGYQKIASLFHEGIDRMKTLREVVTKVTKPREYAIKVEELQVLLNAQCQEREALEQDLVSLKHKVATLSRMPDQVSDAELKQQMDDIWQQVQSWVKTNFRQSKTVPACVEEMPAMSESSLVLLGDYLRGISGTSKFHMLKVGCAVIGRELTRMLDDFYFGIDGESFGILFQLADPSKVGDSDYQEWRARTAGRLNSVQPADLQNAIHHRLVAISHDIDLLGRELFGAEQDDSRLQHLLEILGATVKLGHTCSAQRSRLAFHMPHFNVDQGTLFDPNMMENISSVETIESCDAMVKLAVFPCLYKYDYNSDSQEATVISKAKVYCYEH